MHKKHKKQIKFLLFCVFLFSISVTAGYIIKQTVDSRKAVAVDDKVDKTKQEDTKNDTNKTNDLSAQETPIVPVSTEVILSSVGDCTIGWDSKFSLDGSLAQVFNDNGKDYSYFFKNVADIFRKDDITTANLETTFTTSTSKADKEFTFKAPPDYAKALTLASIEGVNIANNHIRDYLDKGLADTKSALKAENVNYFGEGEKWITEVKGIKFGFLGYRGFSYDNNFLSGLKKDIQELKSQNCIVVINFHWGIENSNYPNDIQKYLAHYSIDNGADLIIGHHPHVIEGLESYKGKIICYSMGNFCFGGNKNPVDKDTFIFQAKFKFEDNKLKSYGIRAIPCTISSVNYKNDYCPTPVDGSKKMDILSRLNKYSTNLNFKLDDNFYYIGVNN